MLMTPTRPMARQAGGDSTAREPAAAGAAADAPAPDAAAAEINRRWAQLRRGD